MAKLTLGDVGSGYNLQTVVNANNTLLEAALENTLSRDGTTPNTMSASLDMNSHRIINVAAGTSSSDAARLSDINLGLIEIQMACSNLTSALTAATTVGYLRAPRAMTISAVRASLLTASSSGIVTIDINKNGSTILSTKLTIDANETTSVTAATAYVLSGTTVADDDLITVDIDGAGTNAAGLSITILGVRA